MNQGHIRKTQQRISALDFIRGAALALIVFHHTIMNLRYMFSLDVCAFQDDYWFIGVGRPVVLAVFLVVSGMSSVFSRSNLKRGIRMLVFGFLETAVTWAIDRWVAPVGVIYFNVIHVIALSVLFYSFLIFLAEKWIGRSKTKRDPSLTDAGGEALKLILPLFCGAGGIFASPLIDPVLPDTTGNPLLVMLGVLPAGKHCMDMMSLFPGFGFFLIGAAAGRILFLPRGTAASRKICDEAPDGGDCPRQAKNDKFCGTAFAAFARPFCFLGRNALSVYVLHQPVVIALIALVLRVFRIR